MSWASRESQVCTFATGLFEVSLPYNLQQLNIGFHNIQQHGTQAEERLAAKILDGINGVGNDPSYLDLPAYDAIRRLGTGSEAYAPIPPSSGALYLGPFHPLVLRDTFGRLVPELEKWLSADKGSDDIKPRIYKLLEYDRAQMINQTLYQAIRRHDVCLVDWTWLRPNVFFEFGVRAACRADGAVHIAANLRPKNRQVVNQLGVCWPQRPPSQSTEMASLSRKSSPDLTGLHHVKPNFRTLIKNI